MLEVTENIIRAVMVKSFKDFICSSVIYQNRYYPLRLITIIIVYCALALNEFILYYVLLVRCAQQIWIYESSENDEQIKGSRYNQKGISEKGIDSDTTCLGLGKASWESIYNLLEAEDPEEIEEEKGTTDSTNK